MDKTVREVDVPVVDRLPSDVYKATVDMADICYLGYRPGAPAHRAYENIFPWVGDRVGVPEGTTVVRTRFVIGDYACNGRSY